RERARPRRRGPGSWHGSRKHLAKDERQTDYRPRDLARLGRVVHLAEPSARVPEARVRGRDLEIGAARVAAPEGPRDGHDEPCLPLLRSRGARLARDPPGRPGEPLARHPRDGSRRLDAVLLAARVVDRPLDRLLGAHADREPRLADLNVLASAELREERARLDA